jgi:hypothetical protein
MRHLIIIVLLGVIGQCNAGTFDMDTIENFQIYNGDKLVLAGLGPGTEFQTIVIKRADLADLGIQFNYDVGFENVILIIEITDERGKKVLTKTFKIDSGTRMKIERNEFRQLTAKSMTIRYLEKREYGLDKILAKINLE